MGPKNNFDQHVRHVYPQPIAYAPSMVDYNYMSYHYLRFLEYVHDQEYDHYLREHIHGYQDSMPRNEYFAYLEGYRHRRY